MSYTIVDQLTLDVDFGGRVRACVTEQSNVFKDDTRPDLVALADDCLRGAPLPILAFIRLTAAGPGIAARATGEDGNVEQANVEDPDILALVQGTFPLVAHLYFDQDGNRRPT